MKKAKLFQNGQSQAVRLPREFRFSGQEVYIKKFGNATLLIPTENSWENWQKSLNMFSDDFMEQRNQPDHQDRESL